LALVASGLVAAVYWGLANQISIDAPRFVLEVAVVAVTGLAAGVADRRRRWWATWGAAIAVTASFVVAAAHWWVSASGLIADHYPPSMLVWVWFGLWAVGVAATGWWSGAFVIRMVRVLTAPVTVLAVFLLINAHYGYWPTVGTVLNRPVAGQVSASALSHQLDARRSPPIVTAEPPTPTLVHSLGLYAPIAIPALPVPFAAAPASVWLPPAYFHSPDTRLPVLVMLTGVPGTSHDWVTAGQVIPLANSWASRHDGVAPIMIFVDENGRGNRDTECVNGPEGAADSYLTQDLPAWADRTLGISPDPARWGVVGFSEGGTCALGLATENPNLFGAFVDIAGDTAPNHGSAAATLRYLYADNPEAFRSFQPQSVLSVRHFGHVEGWFAAGSGDRTSLIAVRDLAPLASRAGIATDVYEAPGGHTWLFARQSFAHIYPALAATLCGQPLANPASAGGHEGPRLPQRPSRSTSHDRRTPSFPTSGQMPEAGST
jgi:enterochelin esterase-like enzyme